MNLSQTQLAYIAGFIDGEAHLGCQRQTQPNGRTPRFVLRLSFTQATEEPLQTLCHWLGCHVTRYPATSPNRSPRWRMTITKNVAVSLLRACLPYLILKRRQAELVLEIERVRALASPDRKAFGRQGGKSLPMPASAVAMMDELHHQLSSLRSNKRPINSRRLV